MAFSELNKEWRYQNHLPDDEEVTGVDSRFRDGCVVSEAACWISFCDVSSLPQSSSAVFHNPEVLFVVAVSPFTGRGTPPT